MNVRIHPSWANALHEEFAQPYFANLVSFVEAEYASTTVYPPANLIFNAFDHCPLGNVKVVILGQDPYHEPNQAQGLAFSVPDGVRIPPSLVNIYKEIASDTGRPIPPSGNLERWTTQGVLLLNATLTVRMHAAGSHQGKGWEQFTDSVIRLVSDTQPAVVFLLWGSYAIRKAELIDAHKHLILTAPHPSPLSAYRGFFGCRHFSQANNFLMQHGLSPIEW